MEHVLWIGGPSGVGKTTLATRLARRHGFRLYHSDARTWEHRDRALAAGNAAAARWEALPREQRWVGHPADELLAMALHHERGPMTVDDVAALPASPTIVAEGTVLSPRLVPDPRRAVWLVPTRERRGESVLATAIADAIDRDLAGTAVHVVPVDGSRDAEATVEHVEGLLAGVLANAPAARDAGERRNLLREANQSLVAQIRGFYARPWADGDPEVVDRLFHCECGETDCVAMVETTVAAASVAPVLADGHALGSRR